MSDTSLFESRFIKLTYLYCTHEVVTTKFQERISRSANHATMTKRGPPLQKVQRSFREQFAYAKAKEEEWIRANCGKFAPPTRPDDNAAQSLGKHSKATQSYHDQSNKGIGL